MSEQDVAEFAKTQLTLPDKIDPADEMSWQHYLYSKLGSKSKTTITVETSENKAKIIDDTVERIVAMSKVLFGLHMVRSAYFNIKAVFDVEMFYRSSGHIQRIYYV